jgi:hypothetical protein
VRHQELTRPSLSPRLVSEEGGELADFLPPFLLHGRQPLFSCGKLLPKEQQLHHHILIRRNGARNTLRNRRGNPVEFGRLNLPRPHLILCG